MRGDASVQAKILALFQERLRLEVPSVETDLLETGLLDSLVFVELLVTIEEEFGRTIEIEDLEIDDFRTVAGIASYLENSKRAAEVGRDDL